MMPCSEPHAAHPPTSFACSTRQCPQNQAHPCIEVEVLLHRHVVEEHIVLRTQPQAPADQNHVLRDLVAIDVRLPTRWGVQTWEEQPMSLCCSTRQAGAASQDSEQSDCL